MSGTGMSHGAITVINAMPAGIGGTIGINLRTEAAFHPGGDSRDVMIMIDQDEDDRMSRICISRAFEHLGLEEPAGWKLIIESDIPISRGLKSSSSACNAIISAVLNSTGSEMDTVDMIRLGVECAKEAGVTLTGSFDDACGCQLGGFVLTDNNSNEIIRSTDVDDMDVVISVPPYKIRKPSLDKASLRRFAPEMDIIVKTALDDPLAALTMNGRLLSGAIGVDNSVADRAIELGALAAGMTGSGPAVAILTEKGNGLELAYALGLDDFIITGTRRRTE